MILSCADTPAGRPVPARSWRNVWSAFIGRFRSFPPWKNRLQPVRRKKSALFEGRAELLAEHGLSLSDLEPVYTCPDCRDTGYIGEEKCHCFLQAEIDLLYHQSHLKEILEKENFHTFSYSWYEGEDREIMRRCVMDARMFIENFDSSFQNLLLLL